MRCEPIERNLMPATKRKLELVIELCDGADPEDVVLVINANALCALEDDARVISSWEWKYPDDHE